MGKHLYKTNGFFEISKIEFITENKNAGDIWRKCEYELTPMPIFAMLRPSMVWGDNDNNGMMKRLRMGDIDFHSQEFVRRNEPTPSNIIIQEIKLVHHLSWALSHAKISGEHPLAQS